MVESYGSSIFDFLRNRHPVLVLSLPAYFTTSIHLWIIYVSQRIGKILVEIDVVQGTPSTRYYTVWFW